MSILPHRNRDWQWLLYWEQLTIFEPRLLDLEHAIIGAATLPHDEFQEVFRLVRQQAAEFVGWSSGCRHPVLRSSDAYHSVLAHLLSIAERREVPQ